MRTELILRGLPSILIENISLFIWLFYKYFVLLYILKRENKQAQTGRTKTIIHLKQKQKKKDKPQKRETKRFFNRKIVLP